VLLILDALLDILVVVVELAEGVIRAEALVVVRDDGFEGLLLAFGVFFVVLLLLRQILLELLDVRVALCGRGEDGGDLEGDEVRIFELAAVLHRVEQRVVLDGVIDAGCRKQGIEAPICGGGIVLVENGVDDRPLGQRIAGLGRVVAIGFEVVDVEAQDVAVVDGVGDRVFVQLLLE